MCIYCTSRETGWDRLLAYDDVYQEATRRDESQSEYGFHESWDELRDQLSP